MPHTLDCPCQSQKTYADCCQQFHTQHPAQTAEQLMRSRYSAYALGLIDYIVTTTLPSQQHSLDQNSMSQWSQNSTWLGLQINDKQALSPNHASVTFTITWQEALDTHSHQERSVFVLQNNTWFFIDPTVSINTGRNDDCICGSHKKFKKCCAPYLS